MTLIAWLLIIGAACTLFAGCLWCIIRVGDSTNTPAKRHYNVRETSCKWCGCSLPVGISATCFRSPDGWCERPTLDPLTVYLMEREVKRIVDEEYDIMEREKEWRR